MKTDFSLNLIVLIALVTISAKANQDVPKWITEFRSEDSGYKYYLGVADFVESQAQAVKDATQSARAQAVEENFGVDALYQSNLVQTEDSLTSHSEVLTRSKSVRLVGFERTDQHVVGSQMFLKFRYSKTEILKEKDRLSKITDSSDDQELETDSESVSKYPTTVSIQTDPPGAHIFIDGKSWGVSPLTLKGHLAPGAYDLYIQKENYQDVTKPMVVTNGYTKVVTKLNKAKATLIVDLDNFTGASVYLNGMSLGKTPLEKKVTLTASSYKLKISHPQILPIYKELELESDEVKTIQETAEIKKVLVRALVFPKSAVFKMQDQEFKPVHNTLEIKLVPGDYSMEVSADNYESKDIQFTVVPGKENYLGTIKLVKSSAEKKANYTTSSSDSVKSSNAKSNYKFNFRSPTREPSYVSRLWEKTKNFETYYQVDIESTSSDGSRYPMNKGSIAGGFGLGASLWNRTFDIYLGASAELFSEADVNNFQKIQVFGLNTYAGGILHLNDSLGIGYETGQADFKSEKAGEFGNYPVPKYLISRGYAKAYISLVGQWLDTPLGFNIGVKNYTDRTTYFATDRLVNPTSRSDFSGSSFFIQFFARKY